MKSNAIAWKNGAYSLTANTHLYISGKKSKCPNINNVFMEIHNLKLILPHEYFVNPLPYPHNMQL